jgi:hypothetical protein
MGEVWPLALCRMRLHDGTLIAIRDRGSRCLNPGETERHGENHPVSLPLRLTQNGLTTIKNTTTAMAISSARCPA